MLVFLVLCALLILVLYKQIWAAFLANPGLNGVIVGVLAIGIILSFRQVIRLYPEIRWVNNFRISDPGLAMDRRPALLAPMAVLLGDRTGRTAITQQTMRHMLNSIATRLDEARDLSRYMTGLLVFLGLLGTFWGLIETVGSVGKVIEGLKVGGDAGFDLRYAEGRPRRPARRHGHFVLVIAVRSRRLPGPWLSRPAIEPGAEPLLYRSRGLAGDDRARILGRAGAGGVTTPTDLYNVVDRLRAAVEDMGSGRAATTAMSNLADAIQGLVQHMRSEQQLIREWADGQGEQSREIKRLLEHIARQPEKS